MLPILNAAQFRQADQLLQASEPISSLMLMERAAGRCAQRILSLHSEGLFGPVEGIRFLVLVGMGNNGGDGLVIARLLHGAGVPVRVLRVHHRSSASQDNGTNWKRMEAMGILCGQLHAAENDLQIGANEVVIDAIFGIGLSGAVPKQVEHLIEQVRKSSRPVIAIDLPSGLLAEGDQDLGVDAVMPASLTLTFEFPKLCMLLPENDGVVGAWELIPIGLDPEGCASSGVHAYMVQESDAVHCLRPRPRFGHKGTFGHALLLAGSKGRSGAAVLATHAALRSGAGLVSVHVPKESMNTLQISCPEAMCSTSMNGTLLDTLPDLSIADAIGIGPGIGTDGATALLLKRLIQEHRAPMVLDADALNLLAENTTWLSFLAPESILTPHPKEFDRLCGTVHKSGHARWNAAREFAQKHNVIVVLKGAWTALFLPSGPVLVNSTGNPGMAKGGSGDALTGLLTGLLAQGYPPRSATMLGVYLHGLAGDLCAAHKGMDGMHAGDLIESFPIAWQQLRNAGFDGQRTTGTIVQKGLEETPE